MKTEFVFASGLILIAALSGCGAQLDNYVRGVKPPTVGQEPSIIPPSGLESEGRIGVRVSPGSVISTSSNIGMRASVGLTQTSSTSGTIGARIGITRGKMQN